MLVLAAASGQAWAASKKQFSGTAAFYSKGYKGRVASGGRYNPARLTAAHRSLPFGTHVRVTDRRTKRSVIVTITDRGPFTKGRVIDLSLAAAKELHMLQRGLAKITAEVVTGAAFTTASTPASH